MKSKTFLLTTMRDEIKKKKLNGKSIIKNIFIFHQMLLLRCSFSLIVYFIVFTLTTALNPFFHSFSFLSPSSSSFNLLVIKSYDLRLFFSTLREKIVLFYYCTLLVGIDVNETNEWNGIFVCKYTISVMKRKWGGYAIRRIYWSRKCLLIWIN